MADTKKCLECLDRVVAHFVAYEHDAAIEAARELREMVYSIKPATPPEDAPASDTYCEHRAEIGACAICPPADAALADALDNVGLAFDRNSQYATTMRKASAALRARPQAVAEGFVDAHELLRRIYNTPTRAEKLGGQTFKYVKLCEVIDEIESLSGPPGYAQEGNPDVSSSRRDGAWRETVSDLLDLIDEPPPKNCRCHTAPPCSDCVEFSHAREVIADARAMLAASQSATGCAK